MRVLFAGPSIYKATIDLTGIELRCPAAQGDMMRAVVDGAISIGLVDGNFEAVASVWHKEILFAITQGVTVFGAASMGALRAAECARFGMIPVGEIAKEYASGYRDDDADVAICHGRFELGSPPTTLAMVDVEATIEAMLKFEKITPKQADEIILSARNIFFKERTINTVLNGFDAQQILRELFNFYYVNQKQIDALELVDVLRNQPAKRLSHAPNFEMQTPPSWLSALRITELARP